MGGNKKKDNENLQFIALDASRQKELAKKHKKSKKKKTDEFTSNKPGVVFLKHIPHGFYEPQMRSYFSQFGEVTRLRLARSKKTHRSRGYAFIEFECDEVAKVVVDTMNNYLMFQRCLKCDLVPDEKLHPKAFEGQRRFIPPSSRKNAIQKYVNRSMNESQVNKRQKRTEGKRRKLKTKLEEMGIEYDMSDLGGNKSFEPPPKRKPTADTEQDKDVSGKTVREEFEQMVEDFDFYDIEKGVPGRRRRSAQNAGYNQDAKIKEDETDSGIDHENPDEEEGFGDEMVNDEEEGEDEDQRLVVDMQGCLPPLNTTPEMIVDLDDSEITFKTPPQKVKKTSISSKDINDVTPRSQRLSSTISKTKSARKRSLMEKRKLLNMTM